MPKPAVARESPAELSVVTHSLPGKMPWTHSLNGKELRLEVWQNMRPGHIFFTNLGIMKLCDVPNIPLKTHLFGKPLTVGYCRTLPAAREKETLAWGGFLKHACFLLAPRNGAEAQVIGLL